MKRDWKLIYKILTYSCEKEYRPLEVPDFDGYSEHQVEYHLNLCEEAGFIKLTVAHQPPGQEPGLILGLTWKGHDKLDEGTDD